MSKGVLLALSHPVFDIIFPVGMKSQKGKINHCIRDFYDVRV